MKNKLNKNLTNIRNFFELIYTQGNATQEEVYNFLLECLKYVFDQNCLNLEDYDITFHFLPSAINRHSGKKISKAKKEENMLLNGFSAYVQACEFDDRKFDIYFPREMASFKITSPFQCGKKRDYDDAKDEYIERYTAYFDFMFTVLHEYAHIIQYITTPGIMADADETAIQHATVEYAIKKYMPNSKEKRMIIRLLERYFMASSYTSHCEMDADEQATQYNSDILYEIYSAETNQELAEFLLANYQFVEHVHRHSKQNQYKFKPELYKTSATLDEIYEGKHENENLTAHIDAALTKLELENS